MQIQKTMQTKCNEGQTNIVGKKRANKASVGYLRVEEKQIKIKKKKIEQKRNSRLENDGQQEK